MTVPLRVFICASLAAGMIAGPTEAAEQWHIKCFDVDGHTIAVKALTAASQSLDVKALKTQDPDLRDVKALDPDAGKPLPVKVLPSQDQNASYSDVKAIGGGSETMNVKAITGTGEILDVKAFPNDDTGRFDIKCVRGDGEKLGLKAISPAGQVYDVKGIMDLPGQEELEVEVQAHIKAIPQGQ